MTRSHLSAAPTATLRIATLAAAFTLAASAPAFANDSPVFKTRNKDDVTVIVIDRKDRNKSRFVTEDKRKPGAATTFKKRDDEIRIRIPRHSSDHKRGQKTGYQEYGNAEDTRHWSGYKGAEHERSGHRDSHTNRGPKIIIVDRDSHACKGSGVCVIRP